MRILTKQPDGGPNSPVSAYIVIEIKGLFSLMIMKFNKGRREEFHTHAFNALVWFIKGDLVEEDIDGTLYHYSVGIIPKYTPREKFHRIKSYEDSWCLAIRGPWCKQWKEYDEHTNKTTIFEHGRKIVAIMEGR